MVPSFPQLILPDMYAYGYTMADRGRLFTLVEVELLYMDFPTESVGKIEGAKVKETKLFSIIQIVFDHSFLTSRICLSVLDD